MQNYVLGFIFSSDYSKVLLIHKNRPDWQKGKVNGFGGKIEPDENPLQAMRRETREEIGLSTVLWHKYLRMSGSNWMVDCFTAFGDNHIENASTQTDEAIGVFEVDHLPENTVDHLEMNIRMAIHSLRYNTKSELVYQ